MQKYEKKIIQNPKTCVLFKGLMPITQYAFCEWVFKFSGFVVIFYLLALIVKKFNNQLKYIKNHPKT